MADEKIILIAEQSKVLSRMLASVFEAEGFVPVTFADGVSALHYILANKVDCILCNSMLPEIDGAQLSSVIKFGSKKFTVPFILYFTEDALKDFSALNCDATDYFSLNSENFDQLVLKVKQHFSEDKIELEEFENPNSLENINVEDESILCAVKAMEIKNLRLSLLSNIFNLSQSLFNIEVFVKKIFELLYSICEYDGAALILNNQNGNFYSALAKNIPQEQINNFKNMCCADFMKSVNMQGNLKFNFTEFDDVVLKSNEGELKSYKALEFVSGNEIAGTLHIVSSKRNFFNYKVIYELDYFTSNISSMLLNSYRYNRILNSEKKMRSAFSKFVPDEIIDEMIKQDGTTRQYETEKRNVAILICDIRSFTTLSESNKPENVVGFLNGYFTRMVDIIKKHGGSIDKFMGDAIMALFGAPISYSDNAKRAVDAAIEMQASLFEVPTHMLEFSKEIPGIDFGIGIHYGEVIVGNIGCKDKTDYTVIGDSANLASRLEGLTKQYGSNIIVSKSVLDAVKETVKDNKEKYAAYNFIQLDKVKVKGKLQGIDIFRVGESRFSPEYKTNYEAGLSMLFVGNFSYAIEYFEKAKLLAGKDKASDLLISICKEYSVKPPENLKEGRTLTAK